MGILQRLAICYGLILSFHVLTGYGNNRKRFIGFIMIIILYVIYLSLMISFDGGDI